eukprot:762932-Hanusia_phi.AAC.1
MFLLVTDLRRKQLLRTTWRLHDAESECEVILITILYPPVLPAVVVSSSPDLVPPPTRLLPAFSR